MCIQVGGDRSKQNSWNPAAILSVDALFYFLLSWWCLDAVLMLSLFSLNLFWCGGFRAMEATMYRWLAGAERTLTNPWGEKLNMKQIDTSWFLCWKMEAENCRSGSFVGQWFGQDLALWWRDHDGPGQCPCDVVLRLWCWSRLRRATTIFHKLNAELSEKSLNEFWTMHLWPFAGAKVPPMFTGLLCSTYVAQTWWPTHASQVHLESRQPVGTVGEGRCQ